MRAFGGLCLFTLRRNLPRLGAIADLTSQTWRTAVWAACLYERCYVNKGELRSKESASPSDWFTPLVMRGSTFVKLQRLTGELCCIGKWNQVKNFFFFFFFSVTSHSEHGCVNIFNEWKFKHTSSDFCSHIKCTSSCILQHIYLHIIGTDDGDEHCLFLSADNS